MNKETSPLTSQTIARMIDHTALAASTTAADIEKLCAEARQYHFASVCVNPCYVAMASKLLQDSDVKVCAVVGFPLGANRSRTKAAEAVDAIWDGAAEVDMVVNVGAVKSGRFDLVEADIAAVVSAVAGTGLIKVILETCLLSDDEKRRVCAICVACGVDFVKTSTGFSTGGATVEDIRLMREAVGPEMGVKASGGVRDRATAAAMIEAGATRIGTSSGVAIVEGFLSDKAY